MNFAPTDEALAAAARGGSSAAFAAIVTRHQGAVRGFLRRSCGNWADADDLAQETFVAAWTHIRLFEGRSSLRSWLCGIAFKKCLSHARARGRAVVRDATFLETSASEENLAPDDLMDLAKAMAGLSIDQRAAVSLCLAQGFSHGEAADALGLPLGTIKSHVQRGRQKLLEALGDE